MKKLLTSLLLVACCFSMNSQVVANAAYQKLILSEKVVMDSGRVNIVEWEQLKGEGEGSWAMKEADPTVSNLTGTGESMIIEPYATADLSEGDVTLSFDVLEASNAAVGNEYGSHLYAIIEPNEGSDYKYASGSITNYYMYMHDGAITSPYSFTLGTRHIYYADKECTVEVEQTADFALFSFGRGRMSFTYTADRVIGVTLATETATTTVYVKDAFPAEYTSGAMRFGFMEWGIFKVDNLVLSQDKVVASTDFDEGWKDNFTYANVTEKAATADGGGQDVTTGGSARVTSVSAGSPVGYIETVTTADLSKGDVILSLDISDLSSTHLYAAIEPATNAATSDVLNKISYTSGGYYAHMHSGALCADHNYAAGVQRFYSDAECTIPVSQTADFTLFALGNGTLTLTYKANGVLGVSLNGNTVYIKDAYPVEFGSGEMAFGIGFWSAVTFDNLKLTQNGNKLVENDFSGDWKNLTDNGLYAALVEDVDNMPQETEPEESTETDLYLAFASNGDMAYVESKASADLSKGNVVVSFDVVNANNAAVVSDGVYGTHWYAVIEPKSGATSKYSATGTDYYAYINGGAVTSPYAYALANGQIFYTDKECTIPATQTADYALFNFGEGRMSLVFTKERTIGVSLNGQTYYIKNAIPQEYVAGEMLFGIADWGVFDVDAFEITQENVIMQTGFEKDWNSATAEEGKSYSEGVKHLVASGLASTDTNASQRLVLRNAIEIDEACDKVFDAEGTLAFEVLNDNFGFAMGMSEKDSALANGSFLYFYNNADGKTHLALGETDYDLGSDLVGVGEVTVVLQATKGGKLTVTVNETAYNFENVNFAGYLAVLSEGKGSATVILGQEFKITNYAYRTSEGEALAVNFNTGYYDSDEWTMQSLKANYLDQPDRAKGITFENGRLNFDGVGIMSYFATKKQYSEYILEFDYIQPCDLPTTSANGGYLGTFAVCIASNSSSGYINSHMFSPFWYEGMGFIQWADYSTGEKASSNRVGNWKFYDAEKDVVTAMKFVVANEQVSIYVQDITETEFNKDNYTLIGTWNIGDTYGYVCFAGDEGMVQSFDNIRITPIDDPDSAKVQENIENFEDRKAIEDDYIDLTAPVVTVKDNVVSWEAVKDAEGYIVTVNGEKMKEQTETEYILQTAGTYTVTVQAVGKSAYIKNNSEQSNSVEVVVSEVGNETSDSSIIPSSEAENSSSASNNLIGCFSSAGACGMAILATASAAFVLMKKRK